MMFFICGAAAAAAGAFVAWAHLGDNRFVVPVAGAGRGDYDQRSFGAPRAGHSHKGVDIFARRGTPVLSATNGVVLHTGVLSLGGNVVFVLGPGMRVYYYAHLDSVAARRFSPVRAGERIGTVGNTGNAVGTPPHLHFSVGRILPLGDRAYLDPVPMLNRALR